MRTGRRTYEHPPQVRGEHLRSHGRRLLPGLLDELDVAGPETRPEQAAAPANQSLFTLLLGRASSYPSESRVTSASTADRR
jgi:hypothetical protein